MKPDYKQILMALISLAFAVYFLSFWEAIIIGLILAFFARKYKVFWPIATGVFFGGIINFVFFGAAFGKPLRLFNFLF